jgi:hypothetical protein
MQTKTIPLDTPLFRGDTNITEVTLRKPTAGELRGTSLTELLQMDVGTLIKVIPRVSSPTLTEAEVAAMDPADLTQLGGTVASFLLPKAALGDTQSPTA